MANIDTPAGNSLALYGRLLGYLRPLWLAFALGVIGFGIFAVTNPWFASLVSRLVDALESGAAISPAQRLAIPLTLLLIVLVRGLGGFLGSYFMVHVANHVVHRLRCQIMARLLALPAPFYDQSVGGHLVSTVTFNVNQVSASVSLALCVILRDGGTLLALFGYLLYLDWKLTLIFAALMPVIGMIGVYAAKKFRKHSARIQLSMGDVTQILAETIRGLNIIRIFTAERQVEQDFTASSQRNLRQNLRLGLIQAISTPVIQVLVAASLALLIWLVMAPAILASITPGSLVAYIVAAGLMLRPVRQLSNVNSVIQQGLAAAQSIFALLDEAAERDQGRERIASLKGQVEFRHVSFTYAGKAEPALQDVSFTCQAGERVAIVGQSGSGKSTLLSLIPRFYQQTHGEILLDGASHQRLSLQNLRSHIALISQQVFLFNGTIRENIAYGELRGAAEGDILKALESAHAMDFVNELADGIDTVIGDDGALLSGGQRQRLAIARALLKNAPILLMDEATSSLDSESERHIQAALDTLMAGRTCLVVTHRLSAIEKADQILVMSAGKIVESGAHDELLALNGYYHRLRQLQFAS